MPHTCGVEPALFVAAAAVPVAMGLLVLRSRSKLLIGWLLISHGLVVGLLLIPPKDGATPMAVDQFAQGAWIFLFVFVALIAYLLPDGRAGSSRWRAWIGVGLVGVVLFWAGAAGDADGFRRAHGGADPPVTWLPQRVAGILGAAGLVLCIAFVFGSVAAVRWRLARSDHDGRLQLLWVAWGALSIPIALLVEWANHFLLGEQEWISSAGLVLACVALPVTIAVAGLRHRMFDIELVLSRSVTYLALTAAVTGVYGLTLLGAQRLFGGTASAGLVAVAIVAVASHPAHVLLRRRVERWVYGYRSDPAIAMRRLADAVEASDPLRVVESITSSVADALKVEHVRIHTRHADGAANEVRVPLMQQGEWIADLAVDVPRGRRLSSADLALLNDLARICAVTLHASRLAADLQASRAGIVTAREEERRRLRADLHDGLGPTLAALILKLNAASTRRDEDARNALLGEIRDEVKEAIGEVRRVVEDLRPPALDEFGLVGAIRHRAAAMSTEALRFDVDAPETPPPLPAAVEVAAFRIACEAMTNALRHSRASRCVVEIGFADTCTIAVSDNGRGPDPAAPRGVGWVSMTDRAAELGGTCTISERDDGGAVVRAVLPLGFGASTSVLA